MHARHTWILIVLIAVGPFAPGCKTMPEVDFPEAVVETDLSDSFFDVHPIDIAVMPVYSAPEEIPPMVRVMRDRIKGALLDRHYSPISFASIDEKLGAFPERRRFDLNQIRGNFDEDALLYASLDRWDRTHLQRRGKVIVSATFTLYNSRTGDELWHYRVSDRVVDVPRRAGADASEPAYEETVAGVLVSEAFAAFPKKDLPREIPGTQE
jgi:hypothetical protein